MSTGNKQIRRKAASTTKRQRELSRRYGGFSVDVAFKSRTPYYVVAQYRSGENLMKEHRDTLRSLGLGKIGAKAVVPAQRAARGMMLEVAPYISATPIRRPSQAPGIRILGLDKQGRPTRPDKSPFGPTRPDRVLLLRGEWSDDSSESDLAASAELVAAIRDTVRLVRPELSDAEVDAAAGVIADDVKPEALTVEDEDISQARKAVAEAIAGTSSADEDSGPVIG